MLVFAETGLGACIKDYPNLEAARRGIMKEVGEYNGISVLRWATKADIGWVGGMGGHVPEGKIHEGE